MTAARVSAARSGLTGRGLRTAMRQRVIAARRISPARASRRNGMARRATGVPISLRASSARSRT